MDQDEFSQLPENFSQPGIFELIKRDTLKKMGKLSKEATIQKALLKAKFIRDQEIPMPKYDPTALDDMPTLPSPDLINWNTSKLNICSINLPYCRLGCVCESVNCQDMYDEFYEKHCRDTGDPECMYGCICENPGPHLNGESKWITSRPYKYKRARVRDDEDCGFVPVHMREQLREGRPKRKAQAPTRYRPDFSMSEKEMRAYENGNSNGSGNGFSRKMSRPRRRLCEEDDDEGSDDSDERIISDKKKSMGGKGNSNALNKEDGHELPKKGRPTKLQPARQAKLSANGSLREPSKRERKPRNLDLPEPEPRRKRPSKNTPVNGYTNPSAVFTGNPDTEVLEEHDVVTASTVSLGTKLHVIHIQPASKTCQGMYAILRPTSVITTFVSWDEGSNTKPYLQELKYKFTSTNQGIQSYFCEGNDILYLPYVKTEDTLWLFYSIKKNFINWDAIVCPDLHTVIQSDLLFEIIEKYRAGAMKLRASKVVNISYLNMNVQSDIRKRGQHLYLFFGKSGDVFWFGTPPPIFTAKKIQDADLFPNAVVRHRQVSRRRNPNPQKHKPIVENGSSTHSESHCNSSQNSKGMLNTSSDSTSTELENSGVKSPIPRLVSIDPCEIVISELTTPEILPPSPEPTESVSHFEPRS